MSDDNNVDTPSEDTVIVSDKDSRPSIDNYKDDYDRRVDAILSKHEALQRGQPAPEQEGLRDGESWDSLFNQADEKSQRAMQQLRADYTRKTQELAAQRKELAEQAQQIQAMRMSLEDNAAYKAIQQAATEDAGEFDPYDTQSFQRYVNKIVAERLQAVLQPMAEQQMKAQAQTKVQAFMAEHPDLTSDEVLKAEVRQTLLSNESLSLQDAYWIVKGRRSHSVSERQQLEELAFKQAAKELDVSIKWGAAWNVSDITKWGGTMEDAMMHYIDERRSQGRRPFIDGPHFELS